MKCPMKFNSPCYDIREDCDPKCAWLIEYKDKPPFCAIVAIATNSLVQCGMTIEKEADKLCK